MKPILCAVTMMLPAAASAQSLELSYRVTDVGGGLLRYDFELATDAGWRPGMGWAWLIFADCEGPVSCRREPLLPFNLDPASLPVGPWTTPATSCGGSPFHCGWTFLGPHWIPASGDEKLTWSGTSPVDMRQGELLFSVPFEPPIGGAMAPQYKVATRLNTCYADCNASGALDFFDFLCFQNLFAAVDPGADCDGSAGFDFFDFLCFQNAFAAGCP